MLGIISPQTCRPGTTGTIRTPLVAVACHHCCTLNTKIYSSLLNNFSFVKEKTRLGTNLELQSNWHLNKPKLLPKLP